MTTIIIKCNFGQGPEYSFDLPSIPRKGENILIGGLACEVVRVDHNVVTGTVILFIAQTVTL